MRVGLDGAEIVDADDCDVGASRLDNRSEDQAADAAKSIDRHANCHDLPLVLEARERRRGGGLGGNAEVLVEFLIGGAGAETMHADETAIGSDIALPAHWS